MKKIFTAITAVVLFISASAQTAETHTAKRHRPFVSVGTNWAPGYNLSYSAEVGTWGTSSLMSYSGTFDVVPNYGTISYWVGAKAYFTVGGNDKMCYMVYVAPKWDTKKTGLLEFGFNPYYTLSNDWLLGVAVGDQVFAGSPWNLFGSIGVVYMFRNK